MAKDIAIYGAGGFGKEVACLIDRINNSQPEPQWNLVGFFDDGKAIGTEISHYGSVLGGMTELNAWSSPLAVSIAIGRPSTVCSIESRINNPLISYPNLIDPNFRIIDNRSFNIGVGNIIQSDCVASCDVYIGNFNVLNGSVVLGHDVTIHDYNVIMPGVRVSGGVNIGFHNFLGVNSVVLQLLTIGQDVT